MLSVSIYVNERLEEVKDKGVKERSARDDAPASADASSTHEDAMYTIMALNPALAGQILE
ncbi:hypothetical protein BV22DRAFT_1133907 [Leucogyrophana mollusca]|uniref:Uncharacterized protein n=1 Tax=Leucogyrophana mollusca TaxID=85980 RepID=A0ACB8B1C9_9AGAM|nr:hypothetical protein BV22DRAFT_1133907 [Leucogyrophana mollusca]